MENPPGCGLTSKHQIINEHEGVAADSTDDGSEYDDPFERVAELIENLSIYQLYRLQTRIDIILEHPERLKSSARKIAPGVEIEYFCLRENRCMRAMVGKVNRTTVDVTNVEDGKQWRIELAAINTDGTDVDFKTSGTNRKLSRHDLSVGQVVGFQDRDYQDQIGTIIRLNPKTVTLECEFGTKWRVDYSLLFQIFEAHASGDDDFDSDRPQQQLLVD